MEGGGFSGSLLKLASDETVKLLEVPLSETSSFLSHEFLCFSEIKLASFPIREETSAVNE